ncbi:hypothetical protein KEM55_002469 [Ascosphaera atra]|nr:hypothetical protein KEM55_002469 [Ascosphaera atra]
MLSTTATTLLSAAFTVTYVIPFYVLSGSRASPSVSRSSPSVIQSRIQAVTISSTLCSIGVFVFLVGWAKNSPLEAVRTMGWWPVGVVDTLRCLLLTAILFLGPLFLSVIVDGDWKGWVCGARVVEMARDWVAWRNYVAAPITEEIVFRSVMISIQLAASMSPSRIVFITPLYFGIAHVHHLIETRIADPGFYWTPLLIRTVVQFAYTTLFGWYESFLYLRTGSLLAVIVVHAFCNVIGLPQFWGRVERFKPVYPEGTDGPIVRYKRTEWTFTYYVLLVVGAVGFHRYFWTLTESSNALAVI